MSGVSFTVEVDDLATGQELRALIDRMENRQPFLQAVGHGLVNSTQKRFDRGIAPDGAAWKVLAAATIRQRTRKGLTPIKILLARGKLRGSIINQVEGDGVLVGASAAGDQKDYARIHQLGGTISKPARTGKIYRMKDENGQVGRRFASKDTANHVTDVSIPAHTITIPARPYLGVSAEDEKWILEDAEDWLLGRL